MTIRVTQKQRNQVLELLEQQHDRQTIAQIVGVTPGQVSAIAAHVSMGRYRVPSSEIASRVTQMPTALSTTKRGPISPHSVLIGFQKGSNDPIYWNPIPEVGSANPHVLIVGETGFGKTYATVCLIRELSSVGIGSLIVDYGQGFSAKADLSDTPFLPGAIHCELGRDGIALNPLEILPTDLHGPASVAQRVADSFARVYQRIGIQQHSTLRSAILSVFSNRRITVQDRRSWRKPAPQLMHLHDELVALSEIGDAVNRRLASSLLSHISALFLFRIFRDDGTRLTWEALLRDGVTVFSLKGLESRVQLLVTEFLLWSCCAYLESRGPRKLASFLVLDEAHRLKITEGSPVEQLTREARKFGLGLILASQQPEDFSLVAFANTGTKIIFQVTDDRSIVSRYLHRKSTNHTFSEIFQTITRLPRGWAYVMTENVGNVVRVASLSERPRLGPRSRGSNDSRAEETV